MTEPKIRFKRFDGEWINYSFQDFICPAGEKNRDNLDYESYSITNESGFVPQNEKFVNGGTMKNADKKMYYIVQPNTFAYNPARINVGSIGFQNLNFPVIVSSLYVLFKTADACNDQFLSSWFKTSLFSKQVLKAQEGGVRLYFFYDKLKNSSINLPSFKEQQAIADFFQSLDSMISLTSKKIEKLKLTLTGCMQTMFPQEGELEPKIRFKGFEGEWKVLRIGDISKNIKRVVPNSNAPIMMITAQNGFINQSDRYSFNNAGESLKKYIELRKRELAYNHGASKLRPYGSCFALNVEKARVPFVYHCFTVNDNSDPEFISLVLNNAGVNDQLRKIITSGARMDGLLNISFEEYCSLILQLPSLEEQQRIVTYFNSFNEMISLQSKRLDLLKHIKSACLDNMFV